MTRLALLALGAALLVAPAAGAAPTDHAQHGQTGAPGPSAEAPWTQASALTAIRETVGYMEDSFTRNRAGLLKDGPVMEKLHELTVRMEEAGGFLEKSTASPRVAGAVKQLLQTATAFHVATHENRIPAAEKELKKTQSALKLLEAALKAGVETER